MSSELKVTMTTDELVEEVRRAKEVAWDQGLRAGLRFSFEGDAEMDAPINPYDKEAA